MKKILASIFILLIIGCSDKSNEIFSYGIADNDVAYTEPNNELVAGEKHIIESWNIVKETDIVPNIVGTEFGIAYKLNEFSNDEVITIEEIIIFPDEGLTNPSTGNSTRIDTEMLEVFPEEEQYFSYALDYPWEAKPGTWIFQVKKGEALLLEKKFYVQEKGEKGSEPLNVNAE